MFGPAVEARAAVAERVVASAARVAGGDVTGREVTAAWREATGADAPLDVVGRVARVLEPSIAAGRIRARRVGLHWYYGPATSPSPSAGEPRSRVTFPSDLMRAEEAVRRAATHADSAILGTRIDAEIAADPALAIQSRAATLSTHVATLLRCARLTRVWPSALPRRATRAAVYYSFPGGPKRVRVEQLCDCDRRLTAVHNLWRATGGCPFTTVALRRYAAARPGLAFTDDPPCAWTNALHAFERLGEVARIPSGFGRFVRWAPARAWGALGKSERRARLRDAYGRADAQPGEEQAGPAARASGPVAQTRHGIDAGAPPHDPGFVSRNHDVAVLVRAAKCARAARAGNAETRQILAGRPVCAAEVADAATHRTHLLSREVGASRALSKAARLRSGIANPAVVFVGAVGKTAYYDLPVVGTDGRAKVPTAAAAFVVFLQAVAAGAPKRLLSALVQLREAVDLDVSGLVPLGAPVLRARAADLAASAACRAAALRAAMATAALLDAEADKAHAALARLDDVAQSAATLVPGGTAATLVVGRNGAMGAAPLPWAVVAIDATEAARQLDGLTAFRLRTPGTIAAYLRNAVQPLRYPADARSATPNLDRPGDAASESRAGRRAEYASDRVAFAAYATARFAGGTLGAAVARGVHALGELRIRDPFAETLADAALKPAHGAALAALGLLDDSESRAQVAKYLSTAVVPGGVGGGALGAASAVVPAVLALAKKPFGGLAQALGADERLALTAARAWTDPYVAAVASRVLASWDERWDRDQLLGL